MLVGYARVSTQDQDHALQLDALRAAGCERIFIETGSGSKTDRPELAKALDLTRAGDSIVVWRLDRAARSLKHLIEIAARLRERDVGLRSLSEAIDTTTASGRFLFHVLGSLAEMEREIILERTRAGLAASRARGKFGGRPPSLDKGKMAAARAMLAASDMTAAEIAAQLGCAPSTLYRHVRGGRSAIAEAA